VPAPALVILAAGASTRLGTCKALVRLRDAEPSTPLALLLAAGAEGSGSPPLVVTGADHTAIAAAVPPGVEVLENERWAAGRTGGVALAAARRAGHDLLLAPVDVPLVPAAVFRALVQAWEAAGAPPLGWLAPRAVPASGGPGRTGHPVVLGRDLAARLAAFDSDQPLRALRDAAQPLWAMETAFPEVLDDLDGPPDLAELRARLAAGPAPGLPEKS
jgi:molybdenum cofactor cytidylyltransferase